MAENIIKKVIENTKDNGVKNTISKIFKRTRTLAATSDYDRWIRIHSPNDDELEHQKKAVFEYSPKFSILIPEYVTGEHSADAVIKSVEEQTYDNLEILKDGDLKKLYDEADGEYIIIADGTGLLAPDALYECVKRLNEEKADVIYTDEDTIDETGKRYIEPKFKPDFNIDLLRSYNYIGGMIAVSVKLVDKVGLYNSEYGAAKEYDYILRCVEQADGISHIPKVLYRKRFSSKTMQEDKEIFCLDSGKRALKAHYDRLGLEVKVEDEECLGRYKTTYKIYGNPLISIVIPNKDHIEDLKKCMDSIDERSDYKNYEFIIVENNSEDQATFDFYREIEHRDNVTLLHWDKEFNYSAINNFGVKNAKGEYILLLNNDTEIISSDCLSQLLGYCQREDVGAVGAKLYYEDGTLQHAGVVVGIVGAAGHIFGSMDENDTYQLRAMASCDYSAVTAACMMVKKDIYEDVGGFDEQLKVAYNDVDFCMRIRSIGKLVVYNANAKLHHYESKSRGAEDTEEKKERFNNEKGLFENRWHNFLKQGDPYYNANLTLDRTDFSLRV
ncbi:MAG: glycosyltransferase family 2 protein [Lachnospiraceae bacterium]|nr:glycosyltransferase family 2 protein [Lachnospiraceae bacterium]